MAHRVTQRALTFLMTVIETTNGRAIRHWAMSRGLWPAHVKGHAHRLRLGGDESVHPGEDLEPMAWEQWLADFESRKLKLMFDPNTTWHLLATRGE